MSVRVDTQHLSGFVGENEYKALAPQVKLAHEMLHNGTGLGNDFIGWVDLPTNYDKEEFARIKEAAKRIQRIRRCLLSSASAVLTLAPVQRLSF